MKYSTYIKPKNRIPRSVILPRSLYLKSFIKKLRKVLFSIIPLVILGVVGYLLYLVIFNSSVFNINESKVEIFGVGSFVEEQIFKDKVYSYVNGVNVLQIDTKILEDNLKKDFPTLKSLSIKKKVPPYLIITVEERLPFFSLYKDSAEDLYMVDREGFVLGKIQDKYKDLFKAHYLGQISENDLINPGVISMYQNILHGIDSERLILDHIVFDKSITLVYLSNDIEIILSNDKGVQDAFKIVSSIIGRFEGEEKKVSKIDLRYDKVIVSYD